MFLFVTPCFCLALFLTGRRGRRGKGKGAHKTISSLLPEFEHLHSYTLVCVRLKAFYFFFNICTDCD